MDNATRADIVREIVPAARWLIRLAADLPPAERKQQKRSDTSVAHESNVGGVICAEHSVYLAQNTMLSIDCPLPSANAAVWIGEELVRDRFELPRRQETGCRSVILMHPFPHLDLKAEMPSEYLGGFYRLAFTR